MGFQLAEEVKLSLVEMLELSEIPVCEGLFRNRLAFLSLSIRRNMSWQEWDQLDSNLK